MINIDTMEMDILSQLTILIQDSKPDKLSKFNESLNDILYADIDLITDDYTWYNKELEYVL